MPRNIRFTYPENTNQIFLRPYLLNYFILPGLKLKNQTSSRNLSAQELLNSSW